MRLRLLFYMNFLTLKSAIMILGQIPTNWGLWKLLRLAPYWQMIGDVCSHRHSGICWLLLKLHTLASQWDGDASGTQWVLGGRILNRNLTADERHSFFGLLVVSFKSPAWTLFPPFPPPSIKFFRVYLVLIVLNLLLQKSLPRYLLELFSQVLASFQVWLRYILCEVF